MLGTFANYYREPKEPTERNMEIIAMVARTAGIAIERHRNDLAKERAAERQALLLRELDHRVQNVFAIAGALVGLCAKATPDARQLSEVVQAQFLLRPSQK